jgi:transcriptional regulator with XRE-family HTH domain/KaiC/GvpD/RAD55 family RecA-like ATPase
MNAQQVSSGVSHLDRLINYLAIGDNVIWTMETGAFVELFCRAFIRESLKDGKDVVLVNFNNSPRNIMARLGPIVNDKNVTMIDCFTSGKGEDGKIFLDLYETTYKKYKCKIVRVEKPEDVADFVQLINRIEETYPRGTRYIFDSITGMRDLWGSDEPVLKFFTRQCPRLYELDTIAYWILEKNVHSQAFRSQLNHITQVVIDLSIDNGHCNLMIKKAENRFGSNVLKPHAYEVVNSEISFLENRDEELGNIGGRIREIRQKKEISQAQLAAEAGVTPSTISQAESNAIRLSLPALFRLSKALNVSIGNLLEDKTVRSSRFLLRKKNRPPAAGQDTAKGIDASSVIPPDMQGKIEAYVLTLTPGMRIDSHFFSYKGDEFGYVLSGSVELEMKERAYILNEGDAAYFTADVPVRWENHFEEPSQLLWIVIK